MSEISIEYLKALLATMREAQVDEFTCSGISVKFSPAKTVHTIEAVDPEARRQAIVDLLKQENDDAEADLNWSV